MTQTIDGYTLLAFLPFLVLAPALGVLLARRLGRPWLLLTLTTASIGAIVSVTISGRMLKLTDWGRGDLVFSWLVDGASWGHALEPDRTWILNALLFVPAGCLLTLTTRRSVITVVALSTFSFAIEVAQRWTRLGVADVSDLTANIVGTAAGTSVAVVAVRKRRRSSSAVEIRDLGRGELSRVGEIDRTERIDVLLEQHGTELVERRGEWNAAPWDPVGDGEHSVDAQHQALLRYAAAGGIVRGAFCDGRLVGIGVVVPHIRPAIAQLAYLHVSQEHRSAGIGGRLCTELELIARRAGDTEMVVTATPSEHTVRFYLAHGYRPTAEPLPELFELEPEDIHMVKPIT